MDDVKYRIGDVRVFEAGGGSALVYVRDSGSAALLPAEAVDLLLSCDQYRPLEDHVAYYNSSRPAISDTSLRRELNRLCRSGFLISANEVDSAWTPEPPSRAAITAIGFPTRERVSLLRRSMSGYIDHCMNSQKALEFVVADDSSSRSSSRECWQMLGNLSKQTGAAIHYAGRNQKFAYLDALTRAGDIPPDTVRFACLGDLGEVTIGANRNVLLLQNIGELTVSADDDTECVVARPPWFREGVAFDSGDNPLDVKLFTNRASALEAVQPDETADLLDMHEQFLGRTCQSAARSIGGGVDLDRADADFTRRLQVNGPQVRVTTTGIVGDCGWDNPHYTLFQQNAEWRRLRTSDSEYKSIKNSREMTQSVPQPVISPRVDPKSGMCIGLDTQDLVPPFFPVGRAEEVAFGAVYSRCFPDAVSAYLPILVRHNPSGHRTFKATGIFSIAAGSWLPSCMDRFSIFGVSPADRMHRLGQSLMDVGNLPTQDFAEFVRITVWSSLTTLVATLEAEMEIDGYEGGLWIQDARRFIARARSEALASPDLLCADVGGLDELQHTLRRFGDVLMWWPAMWRTAAELRARGIRPGWLVEG